jgi:UDP-N-acetylglucosamine 2-epimerase (non-hydrolysing)
MEAGNRCFDDRVPEEINRRVVDHLSDINLPYTEHARRNLLREGLPPDQIVKTGSPQKEVLEYYAPLIESSSVIDDLGLTTGGYVAASLHREENVDDPHRLRTLADCLNAIAGRFDTPIVLSLHPRTRAQMERNGIELGDSVIAMPPLGLPDYVRLERDSFCTISDSGTITEEASVLGFPAVTIREVHERPEGMDVGAVVMCSLTPDSATSAIRLARKKFEDGAPCAMPADYDVDDVSSRVANVIYSYVDFVNRRVWRCP